MPFSAEELKERQGFLGASECAAALGLSSWFTQLQLYESKRGTGEPIEETIPMMVGTALEPTCLRLAEKELGARFTQHQAKYYDESQPWRRASIDAFWEAENAVIEAKTSGDYRGWGQGPDEIPLPYLYNIHHTFACMPGVTKAFFPVLIGGRTFRIYEIDRDETLVALVRHGETDFWIGNLQNDEPPPPANADDLRILYPKDHGKNRIATASEVELIALLKDAKSQEKQVKKEVEDLSNRVKAAMGEYAALMDGPFEPKPLVTWKAHMERRIDVDKLRAEFPDTAAAVTDTSPVRKLLVK